MARRVLLALALASHAQVAHSACSDRSLPPRKVRFWCGVQLSRFCCTGRGPRPTVLPACPPCPPCPGWRLATHAAVRMLTQLTDELGRASDGSRAGSAGTTWGPMRSRTTARPHLASASLTSSPTSRDTSTPSTLSACASAVRASLDRAQTDTAAHRLRTLVQPHVVSCH